MGCTERIALVTGASGGLGRAIAVELAKGGADVAIAYHKSVDRAKDVRDTVRSYGVRAELFGANLTDAQSATDLVELVEKTYGRLDILVNNAGTSLDKLLIDTAVSEWDYVMALHLRAAYVCAKAALPGMIQQRYGRIINITSMWGQVGAAQEVAYSAAKAGLIGFTKALAKEVGLAGITVNAVAPGAIETEMLSNYDEEDLALVAEATPVGRLGSPDDVARVVRFLADDAAGFITGQVVAPNGGYVM